MDFLIISLGGAAVLSLIGATYYAKKDVQEHEEIETRISDIETAANGLCRGELNGAYSRMLKRQQKKKHDRQ